MGHGRVRKIDFTVNLIYLLSRGHIKPAHKQVSSSSIFRSTPSNHGCGLTGNNRINTFKGFLTIQYHCLCSSIVQRHKRSKKQRRGPIIKPIYLAWVKNKGDNYNLKTRIQKDGCANTKHINLETISLV